MTKRNTNFLCWHIFQNIHTKAEINKVHICDTCKYHIDNGANFEIFPINARSNHVHYIDTHTYCLDNGIISKIFLTLTKDNQIPGQWSTFQKWPDN